MHKVELVIHNVKMDIKEVKEILEIVYHNVLLVHFILSQ